MTGMNDQDRRIAAWFEEVPSRVPERTIEAALAHARTHPRRRDPLAAIRRDPMGSGGYGLGRILQPLPLVAAVGLLLAAGVVGAAVGGWFREDPAVVPPIVSPSPSATPAPSASSEPTPATIHVDLIEHVGDDAFIDITDESLTLVDAESGDPGDNVNVPAGEVLIENDPSDPATIVLTWASGACDTSHELLIATDGHTMRLSRQACEGDSLGGLGHVLRLTFDGPARATDFDVSLETTP